MKYCIDYKTYLGKILGILSGKALAYSVCSEMKEDKIFREISEYGTEIRNNSLDFLDIQTVFLEMSEDIGMDFASEDLTEYWTDLCPRSIREYGAFLNNCNKGIAPPLSGKFSNFYRESQSDFLSDFWSSVCPGNPKLASESAFLENSLYHCGSGVYSQVFWASAISRAFVTDDTEELINTGLASIPEDSDTAQAVYDVFMVLENCETLKQMQLTLLRIWGDRDIYSSSLTFAFALLSILYGEGDIKKTLDCALSLGWNRKCVSATALAFLGAVFGKEIWDIKTDGIIKLSVSSQRHSNITLQSFAEDTALIGLENTFEKNTLTDITDIPEKILKKAEDRYKSRKQKKNLEISVSYEKAENVPCFIEGSASCELIIKNTSGKLIAGSLKLEAEYPDSLTVLFEDNMTDSVEFEAEAYSETKIPITAQLNEKENILWQKNRICLTCETETDTYEKIFGFSGSSHWNIYGPYLENTIDEKRLLEEEIPEEYPFKAECSGFLMTGDEISEFIGESYYYFTRTIVAEEDCRTNICIGATGPFKIWADGHLLYGYDRQEAFMPNRHIIPFDMEEGEEYRFVIKFTETENLKFSFHFETENITEESIIFSSYGDRI